MKKTLVAILLVTFFGLSKESNAQCSGNDISITSFSSTISNSEVFYNFNWQYIRGNGSIEVVFILNGSQVGSLPCMSRVKDSATGPHHVQGSFLTGSWLGTFRVELRVWTNPNCTGNNCTLVRELSQSFLPVQFKTFTAKKISSEVELNWDVIWEQNSAGFAIERNTTGAWERVGYVATLAVNGNSSDQLSYHYTDINTSKTNSQYRIRQVNLDNHSKFSEVRVVPGDKQMQVIVYPNPAIDGKLNIAFEDAAIRDISLMDMSGRTVKQIKNISSNSITIENLAPGMYTLIVVVPATREQAINKIVVHKK